MGNLTLKCVAGSWLIAGVGCCGERINQEGRILGPPPVVTNAVLFNTPQADALLSAMQIFPVTHAWNEDISRRPLLANSDAMIAQISTDLSASRRTLRAFYEMNFVLVPDSQPPVPITFLDYGDESDPSPYPIPDNQPIESWPIGVSETLAQWQQDVNNVGGDRHAIIVQPGSGLLWETWQSRLVAGEWQASNGAKFDLNSNALRTAGWTSGDAAGLAMFPALPRFEECQHGMIEHACRLVVKRTRREYLYPANHYASSTSASLTNVPAMGQRLRLKASLVIPSGWSREEKALLLGLKKYGAIVADNGGFFSISVTPDDRWAANAFSHISSIGITNFEVVQTTGPNEGPRSPGAPQASAGPSQSIGTGESLQLQGFVSYTGHQPTIRWATYSGPGLARFADSSQTNTTVSFSAPGAYKLMLSADDGIHAVAYDAVQITVGGGFGLSISCAGGAPILNWSGGKAPYVVQWSASAVACSWSNVLTTPDQRLALPVGQGMGFFRVRSAP